MAIQRSVRLPSGKIGRIVDDEVPAEQRLLTSLGIKVRLKRNRKTVERMLRAGDIPGAFQIGRVWYVLETDYVRWIERLATPGTAA